MSKINPVKPVIVLVCFTFCLAFSSAFADETMISSIQPPGTIHESLNNEVDAAIQRGMDWLADKQGENGAWSNSSFPALTALAADAFLNSTRADRKIVLDKAIKYIVSCVQPDGGIYKTVPDLKGGGLSNYNTAICMTTLHASGDASLLSIIQNARTFVAQSQHLGEDIYDGGFGYDKDTRRAYTDLLNTYYAVGAMRATQNVEDMRPTGEQKVDLDWDKTIGFIERMQNKPETGEDEAGGFFYNPSDPKAGTTTNANGVVVFRSYGSITYAGMLALIYANLDRNDPRVQSAFDWAAKHWSLEENPGMGQQGIYFFYNVLSRALTAYGTDLIPLEDGTLLDWREETAKTLVSLQKIDPDTGHGYWVNESGRYWESDPVLTTAYCLAALQALQ